MLPTYHLTYYRTVYCYRQDRSLGLLYSRLTHLYSLAYDMLQ